MLWVCIAAKKPSGGPLKVEGRAPISPKRTDGPTARLVRRLLRWFLQVDLRAGTGTTYWWMSDPVLFPFGAGMEYTTFSYAWDRGTRGDGAGPGPPSAVVVRIPTQPAGLRAMAVNHTVVVRNTGARCARILKAPLMRSSAALILRSALEFGGEFWAS